MAANFLFDGSAASKDMMKLFILYSDDGFKISPPRYLSGFFDTTQCNLIDNNEELDQYERQLDDAIRFVKENTIPRLSSDDVILFRQLIGECVDFFRNTPEFADSAFEAGKDGLTYFNLILPEFLDAFEDRIDPLRLRTFQYRLSVNHTFAVTSLLEPQEHIFLTDNSRNIIKSFQSDFPAYGFSESFHRTTVILLPSFPALSLADTMNLKIKAGDALDEMKSILHSALQGWDGAAGSLELAIKNKVDPAIKKLESKIRGLRYGLAQKVLQELKNPTSYTPLLLGIASGIPHSAAVGASAALIAAGITLDYLKQKDEIRSEPLYCIYRLRKIAKKKAFRGNR